MTKTIDGIEVLKLEGNREIAVSNRRARASYQVAHLADGRFAVRTSAEYRCGNYSGYAIPWVVCEHRNACIEYFLRRARKHFGHLLTCSVANNAQRYDRELMLGELNSGLFGFLEPEELHNE